MSVQGIFVKGVVLEKPWLQAVRLDDENRGDRSEIVSIFARPARQPNLATPQTCFLGVVLQAQLIRGATMNSLLAFRIL